MRFSPKFITRSKRCMCIDATHRYSPEHADDHRREDPIHGVQRSSRNPEPYGGGSQTRGCGEVGFEARNVSYKVHTLLDCTNAARSQAHPSHAQTPQLVGNVDVLSVRGRALGLLHGDLNLERPPSHRSLQVTVETHPMGDCPPDKAAITTSPLEQPWPS